MHIIKLSIPLTDKEKLFEELFGYILEGDFDKVDEMNKRLNNVNTEKQEEQQSKQENYTPKIGDTVVITEGKLKGTEGKVAINAHDKYLIQIEEDYALYINKDKVRVIRKKADTEKIEKITELQEEIRVTKAKRDELCKNIELVEDKLDELYKEIESLEGN